MRIIFMGTPDFSVPTLQALVDAGHEIVACYSQPPRPAGRRGLELKKSPVHEASERLGIETRTPNSLKSEDEQSAFAALNADVAVVVAYGLLLPLPILQGTRLGCYNGHASLLPRWRGAAPIQRALMAGDTHTGMMIMKKMCIRDRQKKKKKDQLMTPLAGAMAEAVDKVQICSTCGNVDTQNPCSVCRDPRRDGATIIVVEDVADLWALERAAEMLSLIHI